MLHPPKLNMAHPSSPIETGNPSEWERAEVELGTKLPADYKWFISTYGSGSIDDILRVFNACSTNSNRRLATRAAEILDNVAALRDEFPEFNWPLFPEVGGWLPWGATTSGSILYWVTEGEPDDWTTVTAEGHLPDVFYFNGNMTRFLDALLRRQFHQCPWLQSPIFPNPEQPEFLLPKAR